MLCMWRVEYKEAFKVSETMVAGINGERDERVEWRDLIRRVKNVALLQWKPYLWSWRNESGSELLSSHTSA